MKLGCLSPEVCVCVCDTETQLCLIFCESVIDGSVLFTPLLERWMWRRGWTDGSERRSDMGVLTHSDPSPCSTSGIVGIYTSA